MRCRQVCDSINTSPGITSEVLPKELLPRYFPRNYFLRTSPGMTSQVLLLECLLRYFPKTGILWRHCELTHEEISKIYSLGSPHFVILVSGEMWDDFELLGKISGAFVLYWMILAWYRLPNLHADYWQRVLNRHVCTTWHGMITLWRWCRKFDLHLYNIFKMLVYICIYIYKDLNYQNLEYCLRIIS